MTAPTWTYDPSQLATSKRYQVRLLVGDIKNADQQFQDAEIDWALTQNTNSYTVAAILCRALASRLSREADTVDRDLRTTYSQRANNYLRMAINYEVMAGKPGAVMPYAGGISIADKQRRQGDGDRVQPQFGIGMHDSNLPVAPTENET